MAQINQYILISIGSAELLLPGSASLAIEQRHALVTNLNNDNKAIVAWRQDKRGQWPVYALNDELKPHPGIDWMRAVFIAGSPVPVGLAAREIQILSGEEIYPEPFMPLGPPPTPVGHVFMSAWIKKGQTYLVFNPANLSSYLQSVRIN